MIGRELMLIHLGALLLVFVFLVALAVCWWSQQQEIKRLKVLSSNIFDLCAWRDNSALPALVELGKRASALEEVLLTSSDNTEIGWLDRLRVELDDVNVRLSKLAAFSDTKEFEGLADVERRMLRKQLAAMREYWSILQWRYEHYSELGALRTV